MVLEGDTRETTGKKCLENNNRFYLVQILFIFVLSVSLRYARVCTLCTNLYARIHLINIEKIPRGENLSTEPLSYIKHLNLKWIGDLVLRLLFNIGIYWLQFYFSKINSVASLYLNFDKIEHYSSIWAKNEMLMNEI